MFRVARVVAPKKEALAIAEGELAIAMQVFFWMRYRRMHLSDNYVMNAFLEPRFHELRRKAIGSNENEICVVVIEMVYSVCILLELQL